MLYSEREFFRICLVTDELPVVGASGGIGAAFEELAVLLARHGHDVHILYTGCECENGVIPPVAESFFRNENITLIALDTAKYTNVLNDSRAYSFAIWQTLLSRDGDFDFVHFHDYKGLGYHTCEGKRQGIGLSDTQLVCQLHGPTRWTIEANQNFFVHEFQLIADHLEKKTVELADIVVSPSQYLADWACEEWGLCSDRKIEVIPNLCRLLQQRLRRTRTRSSSERVNGRFENLVIFGRHEDRKGIDIACAALTKIGDSLASRRISVHFVGQQGTIGGQPSALYFTKVAANWKFDYSLNFGLTRFTAGEYIASLSNPLVVVPAPVENSPYAVLEPLILGVPVLSSSAGGGVELIAPQCRSAYCCSMNAGELSVALSSLLEEERVECRANCKPEEIEEQWLSLHKKKPKLIQTPEDGENNYPLVSVGITHFERPHKLVDAVVSILKQDYLNIEVIVVDDGSEKPETLRALEEMEALLKRSGVALLRGPNGYLGAARNKVLKHAKGEYILFLDDDDIAVPTLVSTLVESARRTGASVTSCLSYYMQEELRHEVVAGKIVNEKVDYFPTAGPLSLGLEQNVFGTATCLIRTTDIKSIGGYTELRNVGNEDYELYLKFCQAGMSLVACPVPLFMYEVGRPSMLSGTSLEKSFRRCFDTVEFNDNSDAWADYSSLNVGRRVKDQSYNRQHWMNTFHEDSEDRHRLCDTSIDAREYVKIAADVAQREGANGVATAFLHAFDVSDALSSNPQSIAAVESSVLLPSRIIDDVKPKSDDAQCRLISRARYMLAVGDYDGSFSEVQKYIEKTHSLDISVSAFLRDLSDLPFQPELKEPIAKIVSLMRGKRIRGSAEDIMVVLFRVASRHQLAELQREVSETIFQVDRRAYLERYPDIQEGERLGNLNAFDHYQEYGIKEGRVGFENVTNVLNTLTEICGITYVFDDYREVLAGEAA